MSMPKELYKASVIVSVYKDTYALKAVLDSLRQQTEEEFEIVISEDGDDPEMRKFLQRGYRFSHDYQHLTQPDLGWRKNRALNQAIREASSDYLIFIDGDCVLHPRFVEQHLRLAGPKNIVAGKRVKLNPALSKLLADDPGRYRKVERALLRDALTGRKQGNAFIEEGFYINPYLSLGFIPRLRPMHQLKGCNMSFPREAIEAINGFDEDYVRPAIGEDIDLTWRFQAAGYRLVSARNLAVQYHLHHEERWTDQSENLRMMEEKRKNNEYICKHGLK